MSSDFSDWLLFGFPLIALPYVVSEFISYVNGLLERERPTTDSRFLGLKLIHWVALGFAMFVVMLRATPENWSGVVLFICWLGVMPSVVGNYLARFVSKLLLKGFTPRANFFTHVLVLMFMLTAGFTSWKIFLDATATGGFLD